MQRLDRAEVERLIQATYRSKSKYGLMIKPLSQTYRKHINPFGRYHFDVSRIRHVENSAEATSA